MPEQHVLFSDRNCPIDGHSIDGALECAFGDIKVVLSRGSPLECRCRDGLTSLLGGGVSNGGSS